MALNTAGLQTHIWNNNMRSTLLLIAYPFLIMGIVWTAAAALGGTIFSGNRAGNIYSSYGTAQDSGVSGMSNALGFANNTVYEFWPLIITGVSIWFVIAYFFNSLMVRKLSHSHPVKRSNEPELYNLLENLSIGAGIPMPRLEIIETHARNAFASGIDQKSFTVTVTRGLMNALTKDELEGVLAHELTHILNRDVRLLIITIIFTGMIGFALQMVWSQARYGYIFSGNRRNNGSGLIVILIIAAVLWLGYIATLFTRFAISRNREYMADAGAVQLTKNPEAMMSALMRIAGRDRIPETTDDVAMMCIENHVPFMGMFATHPPIEKRIRALSETTNTPIPKASAEANIETSLPPARPSERFGARQNPWLTRERGHRKYK